MKRDPSASSSVGSELGASRSRASVPAPPDPVDADEDAIVSTVGYKDRMLIWFILIPVYLATGGLAWLVGYWKPDWLIHVQCRVVPLWEAEYVLVTRASGGQDVETVIKADSPLDGIEQLGHEVESDAEDVALLGSGSPRRTVKYFIHRNLRFIFDVASKSYRRMLAFDHRTTIKHLHQSSKQLPSVGQARAYQHVLHGHNEIDVPIKPYFTIFVQEVLDPFYIFQLFAVILWFYEDYIPYAVCIVVISGVSITINLRETRRNLTVLHNMVKFSGHVNFCSRGLGSTSEDVKVVDSTELLPGDIVEVPEEGLVLSFDAVLLVGGVVVNESMLTGESVPVTKVPLPNAADVGEQTTFSTEVHKSHTLFCGTHVIQTRSDVVRAMVIRTGFLTAKGELVRSILFPRPTRFRFYSDSYKFIMLLGLLGLCGFIYSVVVLLHNEVDHSTVVIRAFDLVTTIVPPALPAALTVGTIYAISRLKASKISCISPPRVNVCGKVKVFCFDKTGTLTEDGLDIKGIHPTRGLSFESFMGNMRGMEYTDALFHAFGTCHSLARLIKKNPEPGEPDSEIIGDPLEIKMFEMAGWHLHEPRVGTGASRAAVRSILMTHTVLIPPHKDISNRAAITDPHAPAIPDLPLVDGDHNGTCFAMIRQFTFSSALQRMAVIVGVTNGKDHQGSLFLYAKGAPEKMREMCIPDSVPENFAQQLTEYTQCGYRVIALAGRPLHGLTWDEAANIPRADVEQQMIFLGFLILQNKVKAATPDVINELRTANIRSVMITGDNVVTACAVAKECNLVLPNQTLLLASAYFNEDTRKYELRFTPSDGEQPVRCRVEPSGIEYTKFPRLWSESKAVKVGILPKVAIGISGKDFGLIRDNLPDDHSKIILGATVFARMGPDQKAQLIEDLQDLGLVVGMCGDGANDCGALKAAHVGISLSEAEASIAAPFTSRIPDISCVLNLIREGRCALVTSFSCFKFMAMYSFTEFVTILMLYWVTSNYGDFQYLYIDLYLITTLALTMGRTGPYEYIVTERPLGSLLSVVVLAALAGQFAIQAAFQVVALMMITDESWENQPFQKGETVVPGSKNEVLFLFSIFQYWTLSIAYSIAKPYRSPLYTNYFFVANILILLATNIYINVIPAGWVKSVLQLDDSFFQHNKFRYYIWIMIVLNCLTTFYFEKYVMNNRSVVTFLKRMSHKTEYRNSYKNVTKTIVETQWPNQYIDLRSSTA